MTTTPFQLRLVRLPLLLALLTAGCTRDLEPVSLSGLAPHTVLVEGSSATHWNIRISHSDPENNCAPLADDVTATIDGQPIPLGDPGGEHVTRLERVCNGPLFGAVLEPVTGPDTAPPGEGKIEIDSRAVASVVTCEGAVECVTLLWYSDEVSLEIGAPGP